MDNIKKSIFVILIVSVIFGCQNKNKENKLEKESKIATKIGYLPILDHFLIGASKERDNDKFVNLDLQPQKFTDYATMSEAVRSGSLQGAILLAPLAFKLKLNGAPIKIVSLAHRDGSGLVVHIRKGINSIQELRGKTIAIPHKFSTNNFLLHKYLGEAGLINDVDYKTTEIPPSQMLAALSNESIDAFITAEPFLSQAELTGVGKILFLTSRIWKNHPDCLVILRDDYLKQYPNAAQELITSITSSGIFVEENRSEAAKIAHRFFGQTEKIMNHALSDKDRVTYYNLTPEISELIQIQTYMADKMGLFPKKVDMKELVDTSLSKKAYEIIAKTNKK